MSKHEKQQSGLKLPRVEFTGSNYSKWLSSLLVEASGHGLRAYFDKDVAEQIRNLDSSHVLLLKEMKNEIAKEDEKKYHKSLSYALKNESALALVNATLRDDFKIVTAKAKLAFDAIELIREHWNQSSVTHREFLSRSLEAKHLDEDKDSVLFLLDCEQIRDQLHGCGDTSLTDSALAEKVLGKLPASMQNLASQIRTNSTINKTPLSCDSLKSLFQSHEASKNLAKSRKQESPLGSNEAKLIPSLVSQITKTVTKSLLNHFKQGSPRTTGDNNRGQKRDRHSGVKCENCGKPGHGKPECWADGGGAVGSRPEWWNTRSVKKPRGENKGGSDYMQFLQHGSFKFKESVALVSHNGKTESLRDVWISDSACSAFVTSRRDWLSDFEPIQEICQTAHSESTVQITGKGTLKCRMNGVEHTIRDILYSADFGYNLFPVNHFDQQGCKVTYGNGEVIISQNDDVVGTGSLKDSGLLDGLYVLDLEVLSNANQNSSSNNPSVTFGLLTNVVPESSEIPNTPKEQDESSIAKLQCLHRTLGHLHASGMKKLIQSGKLPEKMINGIDENAIKSLTSDTLDCAACAMGKMTRQSFRNKHAVNLRSARPLGLIHADLIGPLSIQTPKKENYILTVVDDYTSYTWTSLLTNKSHATEEFTTFLTRVAVEQDRRVDTVRYDNGTEIVNRKFRQYCREKGIKLEAVPRYTPQMNGVSERRNRSIIELTRTLMADSTLPRTYWGYAVSYATHLLNHYVSNGRNWSRKSGKTPYELWHGVAPSYDSLQIWGSSLLFHIPDEVRSGKFKFDGKAAPGYFVGFENGYYLVLSTTHKVHVVPRGEVIFSRSGRSETGGNVQHDGSHDVGFLDLPQAENNNNSSILKSLHSNNLGSYWDLNEADEEEQDNDDDNNSESSTDETNTLGDDLDSFEIPMNASRQSTRQATRQNKRITTLLTRYHSADHIALVTKLLALPNTPHTIEEALASPEKESWRVAIESEMKSLIKNGTWKEIDRLPNGRKALPCKWIFKIKLNSTGGIERFKARLVIKGFKQIEGLDYTETFAPVAKFSTIRLILAVAASLDLEIEQMDFSTAFLNGDLEEEIYMQGPAGTEVEGKILLLIKSLYGLKQAPRCWNHKIDSYLKQQGFARCHTDNCLYIKDGFYILLYVDDILLLTADQLKLAQVKTNLMQNFDMHDLGNLEFIVGIRVTRDRPNKKIFLDQTAYCERVLAKFKMQSANPARTPMVERLVNSTDLDISDFPYRGVIGSLMYLMVGTRPDIAVAVSELSRYLEKPSIEHVIAANRVLRYLVGTKDYKLLFDGNLPLQPVAYADADYANDQETRRSTSGYLIQSCGGSVIWKTKTQPTVALSTTEAEYYSASFCCQEICWVTECLKEIGFKFGETVMSGHSRNIDVIQTHPLELIHYPTILHEDNQACIAIAKNPERHARTKHIEVKYHFIRDLVENGSVKLTYCNTVNQTADMFTKPLAFPDFNRHRISLGLV